MKKPKPKATLEQTLTQARIQHAIYGFMIPVASIHKLSGVLAEAIVAGRSDDELKSIVAGYPGVVVLSAKQQEILKLAQKDPAKR